MPTNPYQPPRAESTREPPPAPRTRPWAWIAMAIIIAYVVIGLAIEAWQNVAR